MMTKWGSSCLHLTGKEELYCTSATDGRNDEETDATDIIELV